MQDEQNSPAAAAAAEATQPRVVYFFRFQVDQRQRSPKARLAATWHTSIRRAGWSKKKMKHVA